MVLQGGLVGIEHVVEGHVGRHGLEAEALEELAEPLLLLLLGLWPAAQEAHQHLSQALLRGAGGRERGAQHLGPPHLVGALRHPVHQARTTRACGSPHQHGSRPSFEVHLAELLPQVVALPHPPDEGDRAQPPQAEPGAHEPQRPALAVLAPPRLRQPRPTSWIDRGGLATAAVHLGGEHPQRRRLEGDLLGGQLVFVGPGRQVGGGDRGRLALHGRKLGEGQRRVGRANVAIRRVLGHQAFQPLVEALGHRVERLEGGRWLGELRVHQRRPLQAGVGQAPADELVDHAAEGVEVGVGTVVVEVAADLLGRHEVRRAHGPLLARCRQPGVLQRVRDAVVGELVARPQIVAAADQHVVGLDVTMEHPPGVGVGQCVEDLQQQAAQVGEGHAVLGLAQRAFAGVLHHQVGTALHELEVAGPRRLPRNAPVVEEPHDAGVIELRGCLHLAIEGPLILWGVRGPAHDHLHGDVHTLLAVAPLPHQPHAAAPDDADELEGPEGDGEVGGGHVNARAGRCFTTGPTANASFSPLTVISVTPNHRPRLAETPRSSVMRPSEICPRITVS